MKARGCLSSRHKAVVGTSNECLVVFNSGEKNGKNDERPRIKLTFEKPVEEEIVVFSLSIIFPQVR